MEKYFNVFLEFDKEKVRRVIDDAVRNDRSGYVCAIESNNLTVANKNEHFRRVINQSLVNVCDGSNIASLLGKLYNRPFTSYIGSDLFNDLIRLKTYTHFFLGNTKPVLKSLREELSIIDSRIQRMPFVSLPFREVDAFEYEEIAKTINESGADLIWVSLGAPKQELFINRLLPYLNKGVLLGVGAAFNFNAKNSPVKRAPGWMLKLHLEWLYRAFEEPKKNIPRYWNFLKIAPVLIREERKKIRKGGVPQTEHQG